MANVYVKSVEASSWTRTEWASGNGYVVGDRVYKVIADGSAYQNVVKTFACISDNSSTTDPETDTTNWARVGYSEEYPFHAVDGNLVTNTPAGEVFLDGVASRYKGLSDSNRSFWHHAQNFGADSEGTIIFLDGTYFTGSTIPGDKINYVAKNRGKVTINVKAKTPMSGCVFSASEGYYSLHDGINYQIGGNLPLENSITKSSFKNCVITDQNSIYGDYISAGLQLCSYGAFTEFDSCLIYLPKAYAHIGGYQTPLGPDGRDAVWKNTTFALNFGNSNNYEPYFYSVSASTPISLEKCIFYAISTAYSGSATSHSPVDKHDLIGSGVKATDCIVFSVDSSKPEFISSNSGCVVQDPLFLDGSNGDFRLRPTSPCIGGSAGASKESLLEAEYPNGKWFDSNAASGGDGSWAAPYNNYGEAINSFSGNEAVVLIKEGQHGLQQGYWGGTSWSMNNDLPKTYSGGIKFIGTGSGSVLTSNTSVTSYCAFWAQADISNPNLRDTPFLFKDFDILLNNSAIINRGLIGARRAEYININVTQAPNLGTINSQLFDYMHQSGSNDSGEYLKMSGCTINISQSINSSNTNFLVGSNGGMKQFSGCTFADLNRVTSTSAQSPVSFISSGFGSYPGSFVKSCIFYTKASNTTSFGGNGNATLELKNNSVYSEVNSISIHASWENNGIVAADPSFVSTEPHDFDLRLRPSSPLIGGISQAKYSADTIWVQPGSGTGTGTKDDPFYWSQYSDAFLATTQSSSKQLVFKDGTYIWNNSAIQDDNVGNNITMVAENMHQAIFTDGGRISSAGKNPTLRFKGIQLVVNDHFTWHGECHYIFDSVHFLSHKYMGALSLTATGCIFEVPTGVNTYMLSSGVLDVKNCIFVDHNDRQAAYDYLTGATGGTIKSCIFYVKYPRDKCVAPNSATLENCATENITNPENGVLFSDNLGFLDIDNKNYSLRPQSRLIGQG